MKFNGVSTAEDAYYGPVSFDRRGPNGEERLITFIAKPVPSFDDFNARCPEPESDQVVFAKNAEGKITKQADTDSDSYREKLVRHGRQRWGYLILKSLEESPGLEWEKCSLEDPESWDKADDELREALRHFEYPEVRRIIEEANSLDAAKLEANLATFFQQQAEQAKESTPSSSAGSSVSGKPVHDGT
jgi:hypothetical protein